VHEETALPWSSLMILGVQCVSAEAIHSMQYSNETTAGRSEPSQPYVSDALMQSFDKRDIGGF
jgi:hypothetical protein